MEKHPKKRPELLVPASSLEVLKCAVRYGADAVYLGGEAYSLRAKAKNFTPEEMADGIALAHRSGVRVYVTANIFAHNADLSGARAYFEELREMKPETCDAVLVSDPGMFALLREVWPEAEVHISTQANSTNYETFHFWHRLGAKRIVAARELSLTELSEIRKRIPEELEIECFVHGSMCISYSGRCLLSNALTGRDANRGACTHPCRWRYELRSDGESGGCSVTEETRPGESFPVEESERGTFLFSSRDLCMIEHLPELVAAGIDSFKIEGRMKNALYVATVARTYRRALDDLFCSEETYREGLPWYRDEIAKCTFRTFGTGFYFGRPGADGQVYDGKAYRSEAVYLGIAEAVEERDSDSASGAASDGSSEPMREDGASGIVSLEQKNKFSVGDTIEVMKPDGRDIPARVLEMYSADGTPVESCPHARERIRVRLSEAPEPGDILRKLGSR